jgi:glycosyltransferase involved in cell wall biosynthesis
VDPDGDPDLSIPVARREDSVIVAIDARTATPHFPGIGRYVGSLIRHLAALPSEFSFAMVLDRPAEEGGLLPQQAVMIHSRHSVRSLSQQWAVRADLHRAGVSLYHSPFYLMPYWPGLPVVVTFYDLIPLLYPRYFTLFQRTVYRFGHALALRRASHAIAISESTKKDLIDEFEIPRAAVSVISLAAGAQFVRVSLERIEAVRAAYGLPERYVLYVGANKPHKNLPRLVESWAMLVRDGRIPGVHLVIAGPWDLRYPEAKAIAAQEGLAGKVIFVGEVPEKDLPALYSGAMLSVLPSQYEGFGLPVLEAMACGTPVLCSTVSSLPEVAGDAAAFCDPGDTSDMAEKLALLLSDRERLGELAEKGIRRAATFTWERTARETLAVYREVLGGARTDAGIDRGVASASPSR